LIYDYQAIPSRPTDFKNLTQIIRILNLVMLQMEANGIGTKVIRFLILNLSVKTVLRTLQNESFSFHIEYTRAYKGCKINFYSKFVL